MISVIRPGHSSEHYHTMKLKKKKNQLTVKNSWYKIGEIASLLLEINPKVPPVALIPFRWS